LAQVPVSYGFIGQNPLLRHKRNNHVRQLNQGDFPYLAIHYLHRRFNMPTVKLTERAINKLPAPDPSGKQVLHWDAELKGFAVLCSGTTNTKTYIVQRTLPDGRDRRVTVGAVNTLTLEKATALAADMLHALRHGHDPRRKSTTRLCEPIWKPI
jgi:hypothetical protein